MNLLKNRTILAVGLFGAFGFAISSRGLGEPLPELPMVPVSPTVPHPVPPAGQHVRFQDLVPAQAKLGDPEKGVNGDKKQRPIVVETGPEFSLADCIAIAIERQPSPQGRQGERAWRATESGYRSIMNFGTVGTLISPDLNIRKQQAQRGLSAACADYQHLQRDRGGRYRGSITAPVYAASRRGGRR